MYVVVGLGNPGAKYENTKHNVGHMVVGECARRFGASLSGQRATHTHGFSTRVGVGPGKPGEQVIFATCDSYMNTSGGPVKALLSYYDVPAENLIVIHDDLDLPFETLKLKRGGGEGGHNGLKSITQALGTKNYIRMRCGIGRPPGSQDPADYVLRPFAPAVRNELELQINRASDAVEDVITRGLDAAQLTLHSAR